MGDGDHMKCLKIQLFFPWVQQCFSGFEKQKQKSGGLRRLLTVCTTLRLEANQQAVCGRLEPL